MQIPTELDWLNPYDNADIEWAKENFFGKTIEEAEELFVKNALHYQEAIMFMPSIPFRYYVHAYMNYLLGNRSESDTAAASCFLTLIESKMEYDQDDLHAVWTRVKETIEHIRKNPKWFDWYPEWLDGGDLGYGDVNLEEKTIRLLSWDK